MKKYHTIHDFTTPFVYIIGWTDLDKWYLGIRYAKGCHPSDLWTRYFTSSKIVHAFTELHGSPDYIKTFEGSEELVKNAEFHLQIGMRLFEQENWLNLKGGGKFFHHTAQSLIDGQITATRTRSQPGWKEKRSEASKKSWSDPITREHQTKAIRMARLGKKHSDETKRKISNAKKGKPLNWSAEQKREAAIRCKMHPLNTEQLQKISDKLKGRSRTAATRQKISDSLTGRKLSEDQKNINLQTNACSLEIFKEYLREHNIQSYTDWVNFTKGKTLPEIIPRQPTRYFEKRNQFFSWKSWRKETGRGAV